MSGTRAQRPIAVRGEGVHTEQKMIVRDGRGEVLFGEEFTEQLHAVDVRAGSAQNIEKAIPLILSV